MLSRRLVLLSALIALIALVASGCARRAVPTSPIWQAPLESRPTGTPAVDEVRVNESARRQVMDGVGANAYPFVIAGDLGWDPAAVGEVFDALDLHYVRLASWFPFWEATNDDDDPQTPRWAGFGEKLRVTERHDLAMARALHERGIEVQLGVWNVGDWMADRGPPRHVPAANYPELAESITAYHRYMARQGVPLGAPEVQNEPNIDADLEYASPEALRDAAHALLDAFDAQGQTQVMLHGPNVSRPDGTLRWAEVWFADARLRDRTTALSYHTWWSERFEDFDQIRRLAERYDKPVWATEVGYCALEAGCFEGASYFRPETWATACETAESYYRAIDWSGASRVYHWTAVGHGAVVSKQGRRLPTFDVLEHMTRSIPPQARFVESASGDPEVRSLAFVLPDGARTVVLLNASTQPRTVKLVSVMAGGWQADEVLLTTEQGRIPAEHRSDAEGRVVIDLPGRSVASLRLR